MLFTTRQRYTSWKCDSGQKDCSQNFIQIVPSDSKPPEITQLIPNVRRANPIRHYRKQLLPTPGSGSRGANVSHINRPGGSVLLHKDPNNPEKKCCGCECQCDDSISDISFTISGGALLVSPNINNLCSNKLINITGTIIPSQEIVYITNILPPNDISNDNLDLYMDSHSFITNPTNKYLTPSAENGSFILPCNPGPYYIHGAKQTDPPDGDWTFRNRPYIEFTICPGGAFHSTSIQTYLPLDPDAKKVGERIINCDGNSVCVPSCNPESRVIKSAVTLLKKNYYTGTNAYLQSRCKTFKQRAITNKINGIRYIDPLTGKAILPTNNKEGSQVFHTGSPNQNQRNICECNNCTTSLVFERGNIDNPIAPVTRPNSWYIKQISGDKLSNICPNTEISFTAQVPASPVSPDPTNTQIVIWNTLPPDFLTLTPTDVLNAVTNGLADNSVEYVINANTTQTVYFPVCDTYFITGNNFRGPPGANTVSGSTTYGNAFVQFTVNKCCCPCCTTIYKPNNRPFAQQGAVDGSSRIAKLKYDTVTKNGKSFRDAFGRQGANAGKYRPDGGAPYFVKTNNFPCCKGAGCSNSQCARHRNGQHTLCFSRSQATGGAKLVHQNITVNKVITQPGKKKVAKKR